MPNLKIDKRGNDPLSEAEAVLQYLRLVPPQHATGETIGAYQHALSLLADHEGSRLWFETLVGLGSHLLESPQGDRAENIDAAKVAYRTILARATNENAPDAWSAAINGLAQSLTFHPAATEADFVEAASLYDQAIERLRRPGGDVRTLAILLGTSAAMYSRWPTGDVDANVERAIQLQEEAINILKKLSGVEDAPLRARALHNLAKHYLDRRIGIRSQNVDRVIRALQEALKDRPRDRDPVGRARTLRGLALAYPEWSGAESLDHARRLAEAAAEEADQIEKSDPRTAQRAAGWAAFERQQSALSVDLDELYEIAPEQRLAWLSQVIENHHAALRAIPRETMPVRWAEWMGGLARLLGRLPSLGVWDRVQAAYDCFSQALTAIEALERPRLHRELLQRWGELCHEIGDFEASLRTYGAAADLSAQLFDAFADPDHQIAELERTRGYALFAAYAAARVGNKDEAVRFAELQRTRSLADLFVAARAMVRATDEQREAIQKIVADIHRRGNALRQLKEESPEGELANLLGRLADYAGADPSILGIRRIDEAKDALNPKAEEIARLSTELAQARQSLRDLLAKSEPGDAVAAGLDTATIQGIARTAKVALVYLIATVHGGMAIAAMPDGTSDALQLDQLTSDLSKELVRGGESEAGFLSAAILGVSDQLSRCLEEIRTTLGPAAMVPLSIWLREKGIRHAVLIPLGSLGLLPLHLASDDTVSFSYAPSALAVSLGSNALKRDLSASVTVVANPWRQDERPLPFTVAEARLIVSLAHESESIRVRIGDDATSEQVCHDVSGAALVHFACHGRFRPSEPLESHFLLSGGDLTLGEVLSHRADLSLARLVTLSACQSGNIEFRRASDESLGFPTALLLAGVPAVVSTVWLVDDAAAMFFSTRLYQLLLQEKLEPIHAMTRARAWLREARADELQRVIASLRSVLAPEDVETDSALSELWRDLAFSWDSASQPYGSPSHWGAFMLTGI